MFNKKANAARRQRPTDGAWCGAGVVLLAARERYNRMDDLWSNKIALVIRTRVLVLFVVLLNLKLNGVCFMLLVERALVFFFLFSFFLIMLISNSFLVSILNLQNHVIATYQLMCSMIVTDTSTKYYRYSTPHRELPLMSGEYSITMASAILLVCFVWWYHSGKPRMMLPLFVSKEETRTRSNDAPCWLNAL